jgi:PH (Pleckstrin Homology) domain-containing protein
MDSYSPTLIFPSKVDRWILVLMAIPLGFSVVAVGSALMANPPLPAVFLMVGIEVLVLALIAATFRATRYEVTGREVIARSPPFRWRIEIDGIESIRPSRSLVSSPALSTDRLEIRYAGGKTLLVSPRDREGFLTAVVARSRHLHRAGEHVRRIV